MYAVLHDTITALQYQWSHWKLHLVVSSGEIRTCSIGSPWFARATSHLFFHASQWSDGTRPQAPRSTNTPTRVATTLNWLALRLSSRSRTFAGFPGKFAPLPP